MKRASLRLLPAERPLLSFSSYSAVDEFDIGSVILKFETVGCE